MKKIWRFSSSSNRLPDESAEIEPQSLYSALWGLLILLTLILVRYYLRPPSFRVFRDLFVIAFGLFCVVRNEHAARQAARPNRWLFRKDTSDQIPFYRWGYIIVGSVLTIGAVVDLYLQLRARM